MAYRMPALPSFHHTSHAERPILDALPIDFNFQPTWGSTIGDKIQGNCEQLMRHIPRDGIFTPTQPRILSYGECFVGFYVTAPLERRTEPVSDSWEVINNWALGAMLLYAGIVPAGWSLDLRSGIQICMWHGELLNLMLDRPMPSTLRTNTGSLASGLSNHAAERPSSGAAFTALLRSVHTYPSLNEPMGVAHMVFGWVAGPGMPLRDCQYLIGSFYVTDWFLSTAGLFLRIPVLLRYKRCAFALFFSVPPGDGKGRLAAPMGAPGVRQQAWALMQATTHRGNVVGGYMDLSNGLQIALYETDVVDPRFLCTLVSKISVVQCLENNLAANIRHGGKAGKAHQG